MASIVRFSDVGLLQYSGGLAPEFVRSRRPAGSSNSNCSRVVVVVRAEGGSSSTVNPGIRKEEPKVVDTVLVAELAKPNTVYCRSKTFPLCDGSHVKHNKETGDNVGPLLLKK